MESSVPKPLEERDHWLDFVYSASLIDITSWIHASIFLLNETPVSYIAYKFKYIVW